MDVSAQDFRDQGRNWLHLAYFWTNFGQEHHFKLKNRSEVSFHHIWRNILIEDISANYTRHQSCIFRILGDHRLILAYFQPIFGPADPHIPEKKFKRILVHHLPSYMTLVSHICTIYPQKFLTYHIFSWKMLIVEGKYRFGATYRSQFVSVWHEVMVHSTLLPRWLVMTSQWWHHGRIPRDAYFA